MKPRSKNPKIPAVSQAIGWLAGYANDNQKDDRLYPVIVWSVMRWPDDNPDEVVGQVFNGQYITEADAMGDEEGVGSFIGYFTDDEEGRKNFRKACDVWREAGGSEAEEEEEEDDEDEDEWEDDEDEEGDDEDEEGMEF